MGEWLRFVRLEPASLWTHVRLDGDSAGTLLVAAKSISNFASTRRKIPDVDFHTQYSHDKALKNAASCASGFMVPRNPFLIKNTPK